jgi:hypothetical protein
MTRTELHKVTLQVYALAFTLMRLDTQMALTGVRPTNLDALLMELREVKSRLGTEVALERALRR